mgnify:FL=1
MRFYIDYALVKCRPSLVEGMLGGVTYESRYPLSAMENMDDAMEAILAKEGDIGEGWEIRPGKAVAI